MAQPVLEVRVEDLTLEPSLMSVCPGYERSTWRDQALARDTLDRHLVSFALSYSDVSSVDHSTAAQYLRRAARAVYSTDKYGKRGEFGELLLHAICCDIFGSVPAISKIAFKDAANDTVKGFDSVHVVELESELELWLGEAKFYASLEDAIRAAVTELEEHLSAGYLRGEFIPIVRKLDPDWPHTPRITALLDENTSLDEIFDVLTVPVLLTYNSSAVSEHNQVSAEYIEALTAEAGEAWQRFSRGCDDSWGVRLRLILLPLLDKSRLVDLMHERLRAWQQV